MAASDSRPIPIKNTAYRVIFPILDADGDLVTGAAGLDSEVSKDSGTFTDCTNEATEIATSSGMYYLDLTSTEMNADAVVVIVKTSTSGAKTTPIVLYPNEAGDIDVDLTHVNGSAINNLVSGRMDSSVGAVASGAITAAAIADGAIDRATFAADTGLQTVRSGTAQAGAAGTVTLDASASATDDLYNDSIVYLTGGTGAGQARLISDYVGSTKVASVVPNWATNPDSSSTFAIIPLGRVDLATWLGSAVNALVSGRVDSSTGAMATDTMTSGAAAASFISEVQSGLATASAVTTALSDLDDIQTRLPAALVSGRMDSSVGALAAGIATSIRSQASGTSDSGSTTTMVDAARTEADTDYWKGAWIVFTSGNISGQCRQITAFDAATDTITFVPATTQAVSTQTYEILPAGAVDVRLWNGAAPSNLISGRVDANAQVVGTGGIVAGSFAAGAIDAAAIADNAIDAGAIAADAITAAKIAANAITSAKIADDAITAAKIATDAIGAAEVAADAAAEIAAGVWDRLESNITTASSIGVKLKNTLPSRITKNTALSNFEFLMVDSTDHVTGKTGLTITAERSIDGGAFAACTNAASEVANGIYKINLSAADLNGDVVTLKFTGTAADARMVTIVTEPAAA